MTLERALPNDEGYRQSGWYDLFVERHTLAALLVPDKDVLDTCCGMGGGTQEHFARAHLAVGVDRSLEALGRYSREERRYHPLCADMLSLPLAAGTFDVVVALESVEHFRREEAERYVQEMVRVLKPAGVMVGTTPICPDPGLVPFFREQNPYHLHSYTRLDLTKLLQSHLPAVVLVPRYNPLSPYWVFVAAASPGRLHEADVQTLLAQAGRETPAARQAKVAIMQQWGNELYRRGRRDAALRTLWMVCKSNPRNVQLWKSVVLSLLPPSMRERLRQLRGKGNGKS